MTISELGYELYKTDWERKISADRKMDNIRNYYQEVNKNDSQQYSYYDYLFDTGYSGEIYVCYEEFLYAEYLNEEYMKELFSNDDLFNEYQKDLEENFYID